ncbi:amidase [Siccirubricoccus sp. KC 17139]|uniref:Amidase n=1 Tax=Siccirubricoccus soli TaxID=2899147 RepID=A0ABT1D0C9_9PROT|nr:amidase [Siccirubricoccus soli]MCO6415373.1 amidase [Siccirubricoccus soli]MCP2681505.1 amidase [Siccirubricoccus soli]
MSPPPARPALSPPAGEEAALLSATALAGRFASGALSPEMALEAVLARIARLNPRLNAIIALDEAGARAAARASAARWRAGTPLSPLDGVPISVKDNITVAGLPCAWGSPVFRDFAPERDELPVARCRAAGMVILGKTNVPEFTLQGYTDNTLFGPTRNPWNPALTPGGSSGGAVAAVAAGLGPLALGTDGGGSIRRPASHTGLLGLKPTPGRVPRCDGLPAILLDFEQIGPIARTSADLVALLRVLAPEDARDPASRALPPLAVPAVPGRQRILYLPRLGAHPVEPVIAAATAEAAAGFRALGHLVEEAEAPFTVEETMAIFGPVSQAGLAWLLAERGGAPAAPMLQQMAEAGRALPATALFGAVDAVAGFRRRFAALFGAWDLILTPAAAALPWPAEQIAPPSIAGQAVGPRGHAIFTNFANIAGLPGIALPIAPAPSGLPIGVQLVGPAGADGLLCAMAVQWEAAEPWAERWPEL